MEKMTKRIAFVKGWGVVHSNKMPILMLYRMKCLHIDGGVKSPAVRKRLDEHFFNTTVTRV